MLSSLELTRAEKNSIGSRVCRLVLVLSLVMVPLLVCLGAYTGSQSREPYVYFLHRETGPDNNNKGEVELVMMAAVSSTLTPRNADLTIGGPVNTRSNILAFTATLFTGRIANTIIIHKNLSRSSPDVGPSEFQS